VERLQKSVMRTVKESEDLSCREGLQELCLFCCRRVRGDMITIYNSLDREEKFYNRGLFCLAVKTVTRSSGWKAVTLIHLD